MNNDFESIAYLKYPQLCDKNHQLMTTQYGFFHSDHTHIYTKANANSIYGEYQEEGYCELCGWDSINHGHNGMVLHDVFDSYLDRHITIGGKCLDNVSYKGERLSDAIKKHSHKLLFKATGYDPLENITYADLLENHMAFCYKGTYYIPFGICIKSHEDIQFLAKSKHKRYSINEYYQWIFGIKKNYKHISIYKSTINSVKYAIIPHYNILKIYTNLRG